MNQNYHNNLKHILIDYDGVLVNTEKIYFQTWCSVLNKEGRKICATYHKGHLESEVYKIVQPYLTKKISLNQISIIRKNMFEEIVKKKGYELIPGIENLLKILSKKYKISIVSNSEYEYVDKGVKETKISSYFSNIYCYKKGIRRKPYPDLYKYALKNLKINTNEAIAIEDSVSGIKAAINAKISVICVNGSSQEEELCKQMMIPFFKNPTQFAIMYKSFI